MIMKSIIFPSQNLLIHALISTILAFITIALNLPVRLLEGLHTYIHPENLGADAPNGNTRTAIRRPGSTEPGGLASNGFQTFSDLKKRHHRAKEKFEFDESNAQIYRLRLIDGHLRSRLFFPDYNLAFVFSVLAISNLVLSRFLPFSDENGEVLAGGTAIPVGLGFCAVAKIFSALARVSLERSASKRSDRQLSVLLGGLGFLFVFSVVFAFSPSVFDFESNSINGLTRFLISICAGSLAGFLYMPADKIARSFWLGTDQLRWNLSVISCGTLTRLLLYCNFLMTVFTSLLWISPIAEILVKKEANSNSDGANSEILAGNVGMLRSDFVKFRVWCLLISAVLQLLVLRPALQLYLNESVLSWYQRLHSSKVPDLDYSRAKIFLHNHYFCLVVLQFFAPPALILIFLGFSENPGNLFADFPIIRSFEYCSAIVKETSLFMAWWVVFVWAVFVSANVTLYRIGFSFIS